jgi:hypothetical protein
MSRTYKMIPFTPWKMKTSSPLKKNLLSFPPLFYFYWKRDTHCNGNSVYIYSFSGNCAASAPISTFKSVSGLYIPRIGPHISSSRKGRPILGIYNLLTDAWMWKLGLRPPYSFSGNICFKFFFAVYSHELVFKKRVSTAGPPLLNLSPEQALEELSK